MAKAISKIIKSRCSVYDFDDETLYINTGQDMIDFNNLLQIKEKYDIESVNIDDDYEGDIILQIDIRSEEQRRIDEEITQDLVEELSKSKK